MLKDLNFNFNDKHQHILIKQLISKPRFWLVQQEINHSKWLHFIEYGQNFSIKILPKQTGKSA
jgi:hypothetical protein